MHQGVPITDQVFHPLDNPAWHALNASQAPLSLGNGLVKRYIPDVVSFVGLKFPDANSADMLDKLLEPGEKFFIIGDLPPITPGWQLKSELVCAQMVHTHSPRIPLTSGAAEQLTEANRNEMYDLINAIQPGYYLPGTQRMGNYFGIRQAGKLVAMAGERMRMKGFTELSAICTHPHFTGRGYARELIQQLVLLNQSFNITPFLHVAKNNARAISLYEHMGFEFRRNISFWLIHKSGTR